MLNLPRPGLFVLCLALFQGSIAAADCAPPPSPTLPRLVDLGADKCVPCKLMAPILASLAKEYAGQLDVVFIDVWKRREDGERYGIRVIPTQIFYDATGKERFRHEGFMPKKDILSKWQELGVPLTPRSPEPKP